MNMYFRTGALLGALTLGGCVAGGGPDGLDPASRYAERTLQTGTVQSGGQTYRVRHTFSKSISRYGVDVKALTGAPLTDDAAGDVRAQNAIRDYFNANVCSPGYYAGIVAIRYKPQPDEEEFTYGANLFCTTKKQANQ